VRSKRCQADGCPQTQPTFGLPGHIATRCTDHKQLGMIRNPRVRCTDPGCREWSTHRPTGAVRCEVHALSTDTNLIERECASCRLTMILGASGHCECCEPGTARKRRRQAKQDEVKHFLASRMPTQPPDSVDRTPTELRACGDRERPDFLWDRGHLMVVLEVDEDQHSNRACECEQTRMINVSQAIGAPLTMWIRFNPDKYAGGQQMRTATRRDTLQRVMKWALSASSPEACALWPVIGVLDLFFYGYQPEHSGRVQSFDHFII